MGIVACLLFGIIGAWVGRSIMTPSAGNIITVLTIGVVGGLMGLLGTMVGWGDVGSFNLYNVLLSIAFAAAITALYARAQPKAKLTE